MDILPYQQGDLDGLCGIYSIINAIRLIMPNLKEADAEMIFFKIMKYLEKRRKLSNILIDGISPINLDGILKKVMSCDYSIKAERPFHNSKKAPSLGDFISAIKLFLDEEEGAVIIGMESKDWEHWSIVRKITKKEIHFFDSSNMKKLNLKRCTTGKAKREKPHVIDARHTFFVGMKR